MSEPSTLPTRSRWGIIGVLSAGHFFNDFYALYLAALLPTLADRFGLSGTGKGLLAAVFAVSASLSQPFMGWLGDRIRRHAAIVVGMAVAAVLLSLLAHAPSVWLVVLLLAGGGIGVSVFHPNSGVLVRNASARRSLAMAVFITCGGLGVFAGPVFVRWCADEGHLWLLPWSMAAGLMMAAVIWATPLRASSRRTRPPRFRDLFRRAHAPLYLLLVVGILRALTYGTFCNFLLFHARGWGWPAVDQRLMFGAFLLSAAAGGIGGGLIADRVGRRRVIAFTSLAAGVLLVQAPQVEPGATAVWLILGGLALGAATPVCVVMAQDMAPAHAAAATGVMAGFAWGIGGLLLPAIGAIEDAAGPTMVLLLGALATAAAGLLALALKEPPHRREPLDAEALPPSE